MNGQRDGAQQAPQPAKRPDNRQASVNQQEQYSTKLAENLPRDLFGLVQWVVWKYELRDGKWTKVPYDARTGGKAKANDKATWAAFTLARDAYLRGGYDGVGFVFDGHIVGIDLDDCRDPETGAIAEWARPILESFAGCYMEASPSGTGVHIILLGSVPKGGNRTPYGGGVVEMYDTGRFFTMTGDNLDNAPAEILARQDAIDALHTELFPKATEQRGPRPEPRPVSLDDQTLLDKAMNANTGAGRDFAALWRGDISAYPGKDNQPDDSRGDFNLARHLVFWTGGDAARIERLMRSSGLSREKWDSARGGSTYLAQTIERAILASRGRYYSGAKADFTHVQVDTGSEDAPEQETSAASASNDCCKAKDKIIAQQARELAKARERIKELEQEKTWNRKWRANKHVSGTTKAVLAAANEEWAKAKPIEGTNLRLLYYPKVAELSGVSDKTVGTVIAEAQEKMGAVDKDRQPVTSTRTGKRVDRVFYAPLPILLESPDKVKPEKPRNHGGDRRCPECGSRHLRIKVHAYLTCMECKHTWETESAERILRGDEAEMVARSDSMQNDTPFTHVQVDTGSEGENFRAPECADKDAEEIGQNHHSEREELLTLATALGWPRVPVGIEQNTGGTAMKWETFAAQADNALIDSALLTLRIRAQAYETAVS